MGGEGFIFVSSASKIMIEIMSVCLVLVITSVVMFQFLNAAK